MKEEKKIVELILSGVYTDTNKSFPKRKKKKKKCPPDPSYNCRFFFSSLSNLASSQTVPQTSRGKTKEVWLYQHPFDLHYLFFFSFFSFSKKQVWAVPKMEHCPKAVCVHKIHFFLQFFNLFLSMQYFSFSLQQSFILNYAEKKEQKKCF